MLRRMNQFIQKNKTSLILVLVVIILFNQLTGKSCRENFESGDSNGKYELLYFSMSTCGYCKKFNPIWDEFVQQPPKHVTTRKIMSDSGDPLLKKLDISGYPTILMQNTATQETTPFDGDRTVSSLKSFCDRFT